jgi:hypothetical protein
MLIRFDDNGILNETIIFEKDKVYELNTNRAFYWLNRGIVTSMAEYDGIVLPDPLEGPVKVDDAPIKGENKLKSPSSKRGKKSHEQILSKGAIESF